MDILSYLSNLKALTGAGHHVHLGKVKAYAGVEGNILADAAAKQVVTQKIIDAGSTLNELPNEDLEAAGIASTCNVGKKAHEHHEWPLFPISEHEGADTKVLLAIEVFRENLESIWMTQFRGIAPTRDIPRWLKPRRGRESGRV